MKIAILTQALTNNYGGILQNYALQKILQRRGHEPVTINVSAERLSLFRGLINMYGRWRFYLKKFFCMIIGRPEKCSPRIWLTAGEQRYCYYNMQKFVRQHINCTRLIRNKFELQFYTNYDGYIVGSDQVWRRGYSPDIMTYFLDFLPSKSPARIISYAASFGLSEWTLLPDETRKSQQLIKRFSGISVREESGVSLCRDYLKIAAETIPDPTMMLTADDYLQLVPDGAMSGQGCLVTYILDNNEEKSRKIAQIAQQLNLQVLPLQKSCYPGCKLTPEHQKISIEDWLSAMFSAEYIVTDSFHGCVFSILFHKQFGVFINDNRGRDRFSTLLKKLDLCNRVINHDTSCLLEQPINYSIVDEKLDLYRKTAENFLQRNGF